MRLPKDIISKTYTKPKIYLCETDKTKICELETYNTHGTFKFNSMSELTFDVSRIYNDTITGESKVHPFYDKIEALRLINVDGFGYFELQGPELSSNGIEEVKSCTAYSLEYTLSQKYLEDFYVNTGEIGSVEVTYAEEKYGANANKHIQPVTLYNTSNTRLSLLHLILEKVYGWKIGYVDSSLRTLSRQFEIDRESIYDFLMNEVCEKFNCYVIFDTITNTINVYAESLTAKFIGDGKTKNYIISPPFAQINTVSVDGYKTTRWSYDASTGRLTLEDTPQSGARIEVVDGTLIEWETDVFVTFDNLSQEIKINYDSDSIKTVLTVTYGDDYDIREVNLGLPYLTDLSYYYTVDWMGQELYDAYTEYLQKSNSCQSTYSNNSQDILRINDHIYYEENRLSLEYSLVNSVHSGTVGIYYIRQQNLDGSYYYTEVSLPTEYKVGVDYYSNATTNVTEEKVNSLYEVLQNYFYAYFRIKTEGASDALNKLMSDALNELKDLAETFSFMEGYTINNLYIDIQDINRDLAVKRFLSYLWVELGRTPLKMLYLEPFKKRQSTNVDAGWSVKTNVNYGRYYPAVLFIDSINAAIADRDRTIKIYEEQRSVYEKSNRDISNSLLMSNNFTEGQLMRLSAFLREDELQLDDIVQTSQDNLSSSFKAKQDAMESGRIELQKLCQPQLQFSMTMANIYALPEFEPIIKQFQLGNVIKVGLRPGYIKQSRLLQVDINFDDFSDFSCEFGDLTNLRTQSDIHADLLAKAINAGKSVATNSSYWTRGSDIATATDLKIQQGLLDAATAIKAIDGTQSVSIDKYGIHLRKEDPNNPSGYDDRQGWIVNNQFLYSDDAFKTVKSVFGEYSVPVSKEEDGTVNYETYWGLLAEAVIAGYIEGSTIVGTDIEGGTIKIGEYEYEDENGEKHVYYAFEVDKHGNVSMLGGQVQFNMTNGTNSITNAQNALQNKIDQLEEKVDNIEDIEVADLYTVEIVADGPTIITSPYDVTTLECKVYLWGAEQTNIDEQLYEWKRVSTGIIDQFGDDITTSFDIADECLINKVFVDGVELESDQYNYTYDSGRLNFVSAPPLHAIIKVSVTYEGLDNAWNSDHIHMKSIKITADDVYENSSFTCAVNILPEEQ